MKKGMHLYLVGGIVLIVAYLLAQYYRPQETDWKATYLKEDKIPFGLYVLNRELPSLLPNTKIQVSNLQAYNVLKERTYRNATYFIVAGKVELDDLDYRELMRFMNAGNQVFIATFNPGQVLKKNLRLDIKSTSGTLGQEPSVLNFVNPVLKDKKGYFFKKGVGSTYFSRLDTAKATILGENSQGDVNFVKYSFGKGALYVLSDPKLLTNYSLLLPQGAAYASKALSYLPEGQTLIWDERYTRGYTGNLSVLRVLFRNESLRWAYFISIIGLLVFVLFEMKRRQRVIPVMPPLKNASLDFVKVVGKLYYQQRDNSDIARKKILYFMDFLRTDYKLNTSIRQDELILAVAAKSAVGTETLQDLFASIALIRGADHVTDRQLIALNEYIEEFYKQAR